MIFERARDVFQALALHSVACIAFEFGKFGTKVPLDLILALNTPSATAADDFPVMKLNLLQTRKRCKRPSAKRAPGRHPGLFQISRLFRARFPADVSPGQEEQPMFWFKDKYHYFSVRSLVDSHLHLIVIIYFKFRFIVYGL